ncbi:MAG TPA: hypothetical protein ENJ02_01400 [Chloroflexi bacterium]|nr:hypothetical protein [Chloroflexota bacterium]
MEEQELQAMYLDDDVIDVRRLIKILWEYRRWIVVSTFGAALLALLVSLVLPPVYEATALAVMTPTQYKLQFDPRIETVVNTVDMQIDVYTGLATSDSVIQKVFSALEPLPQGVENIDDLRDILEVTGKNGLLTFSVKAHSPQDASRVANLWVQTFVNEANRVYGTNDTEQLTFFTEQFDEAARTLQQAEDALTDFAARDKSAIVQNQLNSLQQKQKDYLTERRALENALQDLDSLLTKMQSQGNSQMVDFSDQINALFLSLRVFNAGKSFPLQLQISDPGTLGSMSVTEQRQVLLDTRQVVEDRIDAIEGELSALEPQILSLQTELRGYQLERARLERERDLAADTYTALAHKVDEVAIVTNDSVGQVRIASTALTPIKPVSPRKLVNTVLAGVLGAMAAAVGALGAAWWREEDEAQPMASKPAAAD